MVHGGKIKKLARWSKQDLNLLIQVGTGHALVAHHVGKWTGLEDICKLCHEGYETTEHLFFDCPRLEVERRQLAATSGQTKEERIIAFFNLPILVDLFEDRGSSCNERLL